MTTLQHFAENTWFLTAEMAPYLLLGFGAAGLLQLLIDPDRIRQLLGRPGPRGLFNSCLIGIPMPLCSCSVIPVAGSIRKNGAGKGATAAFLSATPQTGIDSILATYSLMGGLFTFIRVIVAMISGFISGWLVDLFSASSSCDNASPTAESDCCCNSKTEGKQASMDTTCCNKSKMSLRNLRHAMHYGFISLPAEFSGALAAGLISAGLLATMLPHNLLEGTLIHGPAALLLVTLISLPLYVCATASIPMAYALISAGFPAGAALVFLIVGPATNTATIFASAKLLGKKATFIYLGSLVAIAWIAGFLCNGLLEGESRFLENAVQAGHCVTAWQHTAAGILVLLLFFGRFTQSRKSSKN